MSGAANGAASGVIGIVPSTSDCDEDQMTDTRANNSSAGTSVAIAGSSSAGSHVDSDIKMINEKDEISLRNSVSLAIDLEVNGPMAADPISDVEAEIIDPNVVDWDGPGDPKKPINWSARRKGGIIVVLSVFRLLMYVTCSPL